MKRSKGRSRDKEYPEHYGGWKKFNEHIQRGLSVLGILGVLPDIEYPKANREIRTFLTKMENRFTENDLGIKKQGVIPILSVIQLGLMATDDENEKARWFLRITAKLGIEMSLGDVLTVLDGLDKMDEFLLRQVKREFGDFFSPEEKVPADEDEDDADEDEDDLTGQIEAIVPILAGERTEEEETPE